ncbi:hypothetical protein D3C85_1428670 [compost metagenome]
MAISFKHRAFLLTLRNIDVFIKAKIHKSTVFAIVNYRQVGKISYTSQRLFGGSDESAIFTHIYENVNVISDFDVFRDIYIR